MVLDARHPRSVGLGRAGRAGFSLMELVYVSILIGIVAGIAIPRIDVARPRVDAGTMEVSSHLMLAQRVAVLRQHDVRVVMNPDRSTLLVHEDADNDGVQDPGERIVRRDLPDGVAIGQVGTPALLGSGAAITFELGSELLPTLTFHRNGSASEEGAIHITASPSYGRPEDDRAVRVERATGLTYCWSRRSGSWTEGC